MGAGQERQKQQGVERLWGVWCVVPPSFRESEGDEMNILSPIPSGTGGIPTFTPRQQYLLI